MDILFWLVVGYLAAVLFPVPWLSRFILDAWSRVLGVYGVVKARYQQ